MVSITLSIIGKGKKIEILSDILQMLVGNTTDEKWWDSADNQKKDGFYVDLRNGKFHSPGEINLEMYSNSNQIINKYIKALSVVERLNPDDYKLVKL